MTRNSRYNELPEAEKTCFMCSSPLETINHVFICEITPEEPVFFCDNCYKKWQDGEFDYDKEGGYEP